MTDRRTFWSAADDQDITRYCADHSLVRRSAERKIVSVPVADLHASPDGARDRQLLLGQGFTVHAVSENGWVFGETQGDGYSGWMHKNHLQPTSGMRRTHRISASKSYAKSSPGLKAAGRVIPLSLGSDVGIEEVTEGWARLDWTGGDDTGQWFVPLQHLAPFEQSETDPVAVAERLLGTPYLWGGNSAFGIDCSGLVQIACRACGIPCPGDSDQQKVQLGETLPAGTPPRRGDVVFWKGHVAWVADETRFLHANAHHMAVAFEPIDQAVSRIQAQEDSPILRHARLTGHAKQA